MKRLLAPSLALIASCAYVSAADQAWPDCLPGNHDCVLVVNDPKSLLDRAADQLDFATDQIDEQTLALRVPRQYRPLIPKTLVVSANSSDVAQYCRLLHATLLSELAQAATEAADKELLWNKALEQLTEVELPEIAVWMRFENELGPKQLTGLCQMLIGYQAGKGIDTYRSESDVEFVASLESILSWGPARESSLDFNLPTDRKNSDLKETISRLVGERIRLRLEASGTDLLVRFGRAEGGDNSNASTHKPQGLAKSDQEPSVQAWWNLQPILETSTSLAETWRKWKPTPIGQAVERSDRVDFWGTTSRTPSQIRRVGLTGVARITCEDHLAVEIRSTGHRGAQSLKSIGLSRFIHEGSCAYLTSCESAPDLFAKWLTDFENRISGQTLKAKLSGDKRQAATAKIFNRLLYDDLALFRDKVYSTAQQSHGGAAGLFVSSDCQIEGAYIDFTVEGFDHSIDISKVTLPGFAVVSQGAPVEQQERYLGELWRLLIEAAGGNLGTHALQASKIDVGAPAKAFVGPSESTWEHIDVSFGETPAAHAVVVDDWVIASTCPKLTRRLIAAYRSGEPALPSLQGPSEGLVAYGSFPSELVGRYFTLISDILLAASSQEDASLQLNGVAFEGGVQQDVLPRFARLYSRTGEILTHLFQEVSWKTRQEGDVLTTRLVIRP